MGTDTKARHAELRTAVIKYLDTYFLNRDFEGMLPLLSPEMNGIGTASDEIALSYPRSIEIYSRDFSQAPNPVHYAIKELDISFPSKTTGLAIAVFDISTRIGEQTLQMNDMRSTLLFVRQDKAWLLQHNHISMPAEDHTDESYPLKALEKRNTELQGLVREKTAELEAALEKKDFYMRELNHRVKNNLSLISSLISLKEMDADQDLSDLQGRIHAIGLVHDKLYHTDSASSLSIREYLTDLLESIFPTLSPYQVELELDIADIEIESKLLLNLGLIVNEIAINAIKYGFCPESPSRFSLSLSHGHDVDTDTRDPGSESITDEVNRQLVLKASNSGAPFSETINDSTALVLIRALVNQIKGSMQLRKTPTTAYTITFPVQDSV
ncbi:histidine kinase dimerization/phosphoacceptor domain -containing protein [Spirochaeta dissipatitropha]